jgi:hypothetical protein
MKIHHLLLATCATLLCLAQAPAQAQATPPAQPLKVLRYAFLIAETTFDPAQISDLYSRTVVAGMIEAPLEFEFMAKPARMRPNTAASMPRGVRRLQGLDHQASSGASTSADDPAFKGCQARARCRRRLCLQPSSGSLRPALEQEPTC